MKLFQGALSAVPKPYRQPIDQLRMRWFSPHASKVARSVAQALTKMVVPSSVHDAAPGQNVFSMRNPIGKCGSAGRFTQIRSIHKTRWQVPERAERSGGDFATRLGYVPSVEQVDFLGCCNRSRLMVAVSRRDRDRGSDGIDCRLLGKFGKLRVGCKIAQVSRECEFLFVGAVRLGET